MTKKYNIATSENDLKKFNGSSTQENYSMKNINMILFLHDNIYTDFNHTKEKTGSENHHIVSNDPFE